MSSSTWLWQRGSRMTSKSSSRMTDSSDVDDSALTMRRKASSRTSPRPGTTSSVTSSRPARCRAAVTCVHSRAGSLSPESSATQAAARPAARWRASHCATSVVLP